MDVTTPEEPMDRRQLERHYKDAVDYLDDKYAYFLTHVLHIGRPRWTDWIPTAAVGLKTNQDALEDADFEFMFAPKFASTLPTSGMAFILAHETMHIVLNHLKLSGNFVDRDRMSTLLKKREKGERLTRDELKELIVQNQNAQRFNIAADCVINDYLVNSGMDNSAFYDKDGKPMLCQGVDMIGEDAAFMTVTDVYERLEEQQQGGGSGGDEGDGEGQIGVDGRGGKAIDSHDWMLSPDFADELADALDKMNDEIEQAGQMPQDLRDKQDEEDGGMSKAQQDLQKSMRAGSEAGNIKAFMGGHGAKLGWIKLLKEVDPDIFKEPAIAKPPRAQWNKRPRKLGGLPDIVLPVRERANIDREAHEKPAIVLALDVSGSIGPKDADRFIELAKSIPPERVKLFCCTFDTQYQRHDDIQNATSFRIGGGTDFNAVATFVNNEVMPDLKGKYPKAVVVITDGMASLSQHLWPDEKQAASWFWLISPTDGASSYYPASRDIGRRTRLEEFVV